MDFLQVKLSQLDSSIKDYELLIARRKQERFHLKYLIDNYSSIFGVSDTGSNQSTLFPQVSYDPQKATKSLLVDILKGEAKKMTWKQIFAIFKEVKPEIAESTVRVSLSQMNKDQKFPIKLIKNGGDYRYIYGEK